eukprot:gb/GECG01008097.1/.p1 GENE.gb/GECG01008097.1/~~gb/GECG01008097.1/.p1  ORF type:complete len:290 (+),score=77.00 gb/GECG01008097.1/:1-870(+)
MSSSAYHPQSDEARVNHDDDEDDASFHTASSSGEGVILEEDSTGAAGAGAAAASSDNTQQGTSPGTAEEEEEDDDKDDVSTSEEEDGHDVFRDGDQAKEQKQKGNEYFKAKDHENAIPCYTNAIALCPRTQEEKENRAIYHCNRAACYYGMGQYEASLKDCNKALKLNDNYLKAYLRRANANEALDKLEDALADHRRVLELDPRYGPSINASKRLEKQIEEKNEKMKEEMMGKLKDLGNMFLGKFGLSTDNFQVQQDPNSGGYSVNFVQQPQGGQQQQQQGQSQGQQQR